MVHGSSLTTIVLTAGRVDAIDDVAAIDNVAAINDVVVGLAMVGGSVGSVRESANESVDGTAVWAVLDLVWTIGRGVVGAAVVVSMWLLTSLSNGTSSMEPGLMVPRLVVEASAVFAARSALAAALRRVSMVGGVCYR